MALARERLEAIDGELASLGKSDEELAAVVERARRLVASLDDVDATLSALGVGHEEAIASAMAAATERARARDTSEDTRRNTEQHGAPDRTSSAAPPPVAASPLEQEVHPASPPPPDFDDDSTDLRGVPELEAAHAAEDADERLRRSSDIAGLSVDELFADAEPSSTQSSESSGIADLFDDEPFGLSDPDSGFSSLEDELEGRSDEPAPRAASTPETARTPEAEHDVAAAHDVAEHAVAAEPVAAEHDVAAEPVAAEHEDAAEPEAAAAPANEQPFDDLFPQFGDEEHEESTHVLGADDLADMVEMGELEVGNSDEFELLVDEDVLEFDPEDAGSAEADEAGAEANEEGGLISRILGRK